MNNPSELEIDFLLHVQLETQEKPWHATLERIGDVDGVQLEFCSPLELARHVAGLQDSGFRYNITGLR